MERTFEEDLPSITGRANGLRAIQRYHIYTPMWYRTTVWTHARRVHDIVGRVCPLIAAHTGIVLDQDLAKAMAVVHDDLELVIGDEQAGNKIMMSHAQLAELDRMERHAIETLARRSPLKIGPYNYRDLLLRVHSRAGPESAALQFADKLDGFGEAMHEVLAGNRRFATPVVTEFGELPLPCDGYSRYFRETFPRLFPEAAFLVQGPDAVITVPERTDWLALAHRGARHTAQSLREPTAFPLYDFWRDTILAGDEAEERRLTRVSEE